MYAFNDSCGISASSAVIALDSNKGTYFEYCFHSVIFVVHYFPSFDQLLRAIGQPVR